MGTPETIGGDITLNATGEIKVADESLVLNDVRLGSLGNGGNITINTFAKIRAYKNFGKIWQNPHI